MIKSQASPSPQILHQKKEKQQQQQQQAASAQLATITTNKIGQSNAEIRPSGSTTMIITPMSSAPSTPSTTQIQATAPSATTVLTTITTPAITSKSQTVLVKQAGQIKTSTSPSATSFETLLKCQQLSRQQTTQIQPQLTQTLISQLQPSHPSVSTSPIVNTNSTGIVATPTVTTVITTQASTVASSSSSSPATFAALIKPVSNVSVQLQSQQKLPQTSKLRIRHVGLIKTNIGYEPAPYSSIHIYSKHPNFFVWWSFFYINFFSRTERLLSHL